MRNVSNVAMKSAFPGGEMMCKMVKSGRYFFPSRIRCTISLPIYQHSEQTRIGLFVSSPPPKNTPKQGNKAAAFESYSRPNSQSCAFKIGTRVQTPLTKSYRKEVHECTILMLKYSTRNRNRPFHLPRIEQNKSSRFLPKAESIESTL